MSDFWRQNVLPALTNPFYLLYLALFGVAYLELSHTATDLIALRRQDLGSNSITLLYGVLNAFYITGFVAGFAAIVYRLSGREPSDIPEGATPVEKIVNGAMNPYKILNAALYMVAFTGAIAIAMSMWESRGGGEVGIWRSWTSQIFSVLTSVLFLAAMSAIVEALRPAAPSGGADDEPAEEAGSSSDGMMAQAKALLSDPRGRLVAGLYIVAIFGAVNLVLDMWSFRNSFPLTIWQQWSGDMFRLAFNTGMLLIAIHILDWLTKGGAEVPESETNRSMQSVARLLSVPDRALPIALVAVASTGAFWFLLDIWGWRNAGPAGTWRYISFDLMHLTAQVSLPLLIWASWRSRVHGDAAPGGVTFFADPYRLAKWLIYVIAYSGLLSIVLLAWLERPVGPATIWSDAVHVLAGVFGSIAILVGFRAVYLLAVRNAGAPATATPRRRRARTAAATASDD